jgi:phage tail-like protein
MTEMAELIQTFRFTVTLTAANSPVAATVPRLGIGAFAECSGLELEADVQEYLEGGRNDGVVRRVGRVKLSPLVLKRGMFIPVPSTPKAKSAAPGQSGPGRADPALWDWLAGMVAGRLPIPRYNGLIQVWSPDGKREVASWTFWRGLPSKVSGPTLNAKTGEVAVEELHIVHEGLRLGGSP